MGRQEYDGWLPALENRVGPRAGVWASPYRWLVQNLQASLLYSSYPLSPALGSAWAIIRIWVTLVSRALGSEDANSCIMAFPHVHLCINTGLSGLRWLAWPFSHQERMCICNTLENWGWHVAWYPKWFHSSKHRIIAMHLNAWADINWRNVPIIRVYEARSMNFWNST